jgi:hypothetical protein
LYGLLSNAGGTNMKRIVVSVAIILAIILMTLSLQSCFTPYPEGVYREGARDREREMRDDMTRPWP